MAAMLFFFSVLFVSGVWATCERDPKLLITAPTSELKALRGSCLQIPCVFKPESPRKTLDNSKSIYGIWIKSDPRVEYTENIIFNSSGAKTTFPLRILGNMAQNNCTTLFPNVTTRHQDKFFFRVENGEFKATASCQAIQVKVRDSWSPIITVSGAQTETQVVTVTCSAVTPCPGAPPLLTWDPHQGSASVTESSPDGTFTTKITHKITLTHSHDEYKVNCTAAYRVDGELRKASTTIKLNVTYGPKNTSVVVSPPGPLSAGQSVTLSCSSRAQPPVQRFTWFRRRSSSGSSGSQTPVNVSAGHTYSFNFSLAAHGQYYCEAHSALGKQASQVMLVGPGGVRAAGSSSPTAAIAGGIVAILLVIIVIFAIWKYKSKHKRSQQKRAAVASGRPQNDDEVHYGQIHFSKPTHETKSSACDENQETVYSAVKGSNMADSMALYAP